MHLILLATPDMYNYNIYTLKKPPLAILCRVPYENHYETVSINLRIRLIEFKKMTQAVNFVKGLKKNCFRK